MKYKVIVMAGGTMVLHPDTCDTNDFLAHQRFQTNPVNGEVHHGLTGRCPAAVMLALDQTQKQFLEPIGLVTQTYDTNPHFIQVGKHCI